MGEATEERRGDLFREVNERIAEIRRDAGWAGDGEPIEILCECGSAECVERIEITQGEYEAIRSEVSFLILAPVHAQQLTNAKVTVRTGRYFVVRDLEAELRAAVRRKLPAD